MITTESIAVEKAAATPPKWSYMDHWAIDTPQGRSSPYISRRHMERYIRQLSALGFTGFDTFGFSLPALAAMFGSVGGFEGFIRDNGFEKITSIFTAYPSATATRAPHRRETHDQIVADCERTLADVDGLSVENFIVMPTNTHFMSGPHTDESIKTTADLWNRVGRVVKDAGLKLTCHFEFWGAIRTRREIDVFFAYTDPELVYYFCDAAQHTIAGLDPTELYLAYQDRCTGFHFKDTHDVDRADAYRTPPDPELMDPHVKRWFWEMGTPEGLVDFSALTGAIVDTGFDGWLTVEHDKADIGGGSYAESTCLAKWYIDKELSAHWGSR